MAIVSLRSREERATAAVFWGEVTWLIDAGKGFVWDLVGVCWSGLRCRAGCPVSVGT